MEVQIRPLSEGDVEDLVQLSLLAWEPVFCSFERVLGSAIYRRIWPDWRAGQRAAVEEVCQGGGRTRVWVAEAEAKVVGFVAFALHEDKTGEIYLLAVHPDYQNYGIGTDLNRVALKEMKESGMTLAKVETGGDPSHTPARRCYEKAGYTALPLVRYFQVL